MSSSTPDPNSPSTRPGSPVSEAAANTAAAAALPPAPRRIPRRREPPTRRTALTVEGIVSAAIEELDARGVAGLTMRSVAGRLGTGAASLYAHVSGKDELLELVFDELVGQVPLPEPDPDHWREQVHKMLWDLRDVLASHRDAALAGLGRIPTSPQTLAAAEGLSAVLRAAGLTDRVVALGLDSLVLYASAAAFEAGLYLHGGATPEEIQRYFADVHAFYDRLPADSYPVLAAIAPSMTGPTPEERFRFGIDMMLSGMEVASAREPGG